MPSEPRTEATHSSGIEVMDKLIDGEMSVGCAFLFAVLVLAAFVFGLIVGLSIHI